MRKFSIEVVVLGGIIEEEGESLGLLSRGKTSSTNPTFLDLTVTKDMSFQTMHSTIISILELQQKASQLIYYLETDRREIQQEEFMYSLSDLKINDGDRIIVDLMRRNKRKRFSEAVLVSLNDGDDNSTEEEETLEFVCSTRIFESEGIPLRRTRVYVKRSQPCSYLMEDISTLWNKQNLKFRCGRVTLVPEKTYAELGLEKLDTEILVTGGRG